MTGSRGEHRGSDAPSCRPAHPPTPTPRTWRHRCSSSTRTPTLRSPNLAAIKARQQVTWASGDYHVIATQSCSPPSRSSRPCDLRPTERVLDVATGSGTPPSRRPGAAPRHRRRLRAVAADRARAPADAEGSTVAFVEGDAEALPFEDASFDVVTSVFGAMFAPDQERTARRAGPRHPTRGAHRPGRPHTRGFHRPAAGRRVAPCPAPGGVASPAPLGHGGTAVGSCSGRWRRGMRSQRLPRWSSGSPRPMAWIDEVAGAVRPPVRMAFRAVGPAGGRLPWRRTCWTWSADFNRSGRRDDGGRERVPRDRRRPRRSRRRAATEEIRPMNHDGTYRQAMDRHRPAPGRGRRRAPRRSGAVPAAGGRRLGGTTRVAGRRANGSWPGCRRRPARTATVITGAATQRPCDPHGRRVP